MVSTGVGILLIMMGEGLEAEPILREAIATFISVAPDHPALFQAYSFLGSALMAQNRFHEAAPMLRQVREDAVESGEPPMTMVSINSSLGICLLFSGEFEEGEPLWKEGLDAVAAITGEGGPGVLNMNFARALAHVMHRQDGAVNLAREVVKSHLAQLGVEDPLTKERSLTFAAVLNDQDQPEAAMGLIELFAEAARDSEQEEDEIAIAHEMMISEIYQSLGEMDRAEEVLRDAMERAYALLGPGGGVAIGSACKLAQLLSKQDRRDEAMELLWATWESASAELGTEHRLARYPETLLINLNVSRDWDVVDEVMGARFDRLQDDSDLLREDAINLATNGHEAFKARYQDLAMEAARRVIELEGQQDADAAFLLGSIAFLYDDLDEARPWLVKAMDLAGDDLSDVLTQWREAAQWSDEKMVTWDIKVAAMLEEIGEPDRSEQILRDAATWAMTRQGPGGAEAIGSAVQLARHLGRHDRLDEATEMLREIRASAAAELGSEDSLALLPESAMINLYVDRDWEVVDELLAAKIDRQWDDDQALTSFAINVATNGHELFKARYRDLAMKAARRVDELGGIGATNATHFLATVAYYYQEYDLAMRTLEKAIANADDASDEELDLLRERLEEVRSIVRGESS
jgi:tetratricopeptide (TPR) repeat protein